MGLSVKPDNLNILYFWEEVKSNIADQHTESIPRQEDRPSGYLLKEAASSSGCIVKGLDWYWDCIVCDVDGPGLVLSTIEYLVLWEDPGVLRVWLLQIWIQNPLAPLSLSVALTEKYEPDIYTDNKMTK